MLGSPVGNSAQTRPRRSWLARTVLGHASGNNGLRTAVVIALPGVQVPVWLICAQALTLINRMPDPRDHLIWTAALLAGVLPISVWGFWGLMKTGERLRVESPSRGATLARVVGRIGSMGFAATAGTGLLLLAATSVLITDAVLPSGSVQRFDRGLAIRGFITFEVADQVSEMDLTEIDTLILSSPGGTVGAALVLAHALDQVDIGEIRIVGQCSSACIMLLDPRAHRTIFEGAKVTFHAPVIPIKIKMVDQAALKAITDRYDEIGISHTAIMQAMARESGEYTPEYADLHRFGVIDSVMAAGRRTTPWSSPTE